MTFESWPLLVNRDEAARVLRTSPNNVDRLVAAGRLAAVRLVPRRRPTVPTRRPRRPRRTCSQPLPSCPGHRGDGFGKDDLMATKYPVSALLDEARRWGARTPFALPAGFRASTDLLPADWVQDPGSGMVMPHREVRRTDPRASQPPSRAEDAAARYMAARPFGNSRRNRSGSDPNSRRSSNN